MAYPSDYDYVLSHLYELNRNFWLKFGFYYLDRLLLKPQMLYILRTFYNIHVPTHIRRSKRKIFDTYHDEFLYYSYIFLRRQNER